MQTSVLTRQRRLIPFYLVYLNRRHAKKRQELGKSAEIIDESMLRPKQAEVSKAVEAGDATTGNHQHRTLDEDKGLQDVTDLDNEDFVYVY